ncbi:hypothetical protein BKA83DRAFT_4286345 [Pisolithus microcarpus]|nr:hypothetical protein BKA83DRAFT_4286345 [Pisolithus microcarpus]
MGIPGGFVLNGMLRLTYVYYMTHCSEDTSTVKASRCCHMVSWATLNILDTLHVSFMCHTLYHYLITNYGVPTSLKYIVWFASTVVNLLVVVMVQLFFTHKIHCLCRRGVRWLVTAPILLFVVRSLWLFNTRMSIITQTWYYSVTPSAATVSVAEVLITVSLCVLLYDGGFYSSCPRAKRLINTLITYATNRCLLTLMNVDQQAFWTMGLNFIVGKLYTNSLLASLNAREHLRSQGSSTISILNISALHFADPQTASEGWKKLHV